MWERWAAGDRRGALAAIEDHTVDELILHGSPEHCAAQVARYAANGVHTPVIAIQPPPELDSPAAMADVIRRLAPAAVRP